MSDQQHTPCPVCQTAMSHSLVLCPDCNKLSNMLMSFYTQVWTTLTEEEIFYTWEQQAVVQTTLKNLREALGGQKEAQMLFEYGYTQEGGPTTILGICSAAEQPAKQREIEHAEYIEWHVPNQRGRISGSCHWWIRQKEDRAGA